MKPRLQHQVTGAGPAGSGPQEALTEAARLTHGKRQMCDRWARPTTDTQRRSFYTKIYGNLQLVSFCQFGSAAAGGTKAHSSLPQKNANTEVSHLIQSFFSLFNCPFKGKTSSFSSSAIQQIGKDYTNWSRNLKLNTSLCTRILLEWD